MQRVLLADDQIPDSKLSSDDEIRDHYTRLYGVEFANGFVFIRRLVNLLKSRGYQVDAAETLGDEERIYSFRMYKRLSGVLLASIACALLLLVVTVVLVVTGQTRSTIASSAFGIVTTFVSGVIYKYVAEYRKSIRRQDRRAYDHSVHPKAR